METRDNRMVYAWQNRIAREIARLTGSWFVRNPLYYIGRRIQVSHNLGGVCMADDPEHGVVDHAGRVFGIDDLMVLDGSTLPGSLGPNPTLTILALSERAMKIVLEQLGRDEVVRAATSSLARAPASAEPGD